MYFEKKEKKFQIYFGKSMNIKIIIINFDSLYNLFELLNEIKLILLKSIFEYF